MKVAILMFTHRALYITPCQCCVISVCHSISSSQGYRTNYRRILTELTCCLQLPLAQCNYMYTYKVTSIVESPFIAIVHTH